MILVTGALQVGRGARIAILVASVVLASSGIAASSSDNSGQVIVSTNPAPTSSSRVLSNVDPRTLSCRDLKNQLRDAGSLMLREGGSGSADTFYGPGVPQCQIWERPTFTYVLASDGRCGVGYVCIQKNQP